MSKEVTWQSSIHHQHLTQPKFPSDENRWRCTAWVVCILMMIFLPTFLDLTCRYSHYSQITKRGYATGRRLPINRSTVHWRWWTPSCVALHWRYSVKALRSSASPIVNEALRISLPSGHLILWTIEDQLHHRLPCPSPGYGERNPPEWKTRLSTKGCRGERGVGVGGL